MTNYLLPVSGNPDFKQLTQKKHPLQSFLQHYLDGGISVKIQRDARALVIINYDGPVERLIEGISRQAQKGHSSAISGIALEVSKLEEIVDAAEPLTIIETDEILRQERDAIALLQTAEQDLYEQDLKVAHDEYHKFEGAHKLTLKELADAQRHAENNKRAFDGISDRYHGLKARVAEFEKKLTNVEKFTKTPEELRIDAVRKSAQSIKSLEQELRSLGVSDLKAAMAIPASLVDYVNASLGTTVYQTDEAVRSAANFRPAIPDTAAESAYVSAKKDVKFYDLVKSSDAEVPEAMQATFAELELTINEKKRAMADYEHAQKRATEQASLAAEVQGFVELHAKATKVKGLVDKLPLIEMYAVGSHIYVPAGTEGISRPAEMLAMARYIYVPVGTKESLVYSIIKTRFVDSGIITMTPEVSADGIVRFALGASPDEVFAALKGELTSLGCKSRILVEKEI